MLVAVSCQQPKADDGRIDKLETSVAGVPAIVTRVTELEGQGQGVEGRVATLNETIAGLQAGMDSVSKEVDATEAADSTLRKKVDEMAAQVAAVAAQGNKISSVEQKLALLETRYNDHLRKYHGG